MKAPFNPFNKSFEEVKENDLECLKDVAEGWYVEYKSKAPNAKILAKTISSFANSHGGLLFIGVDQDSQSNTCKEIIGVDISPDFVRDSVRGNIHPFPFFKTFSIKLSNGKNVLIVAIPEGDNPPYIHSNGKIYIRQESGSDPSSKIDRYKIDELYRKAQKYKEEVENFRKTELSFCKAEDDTPFLEVYANTIPFKAKFLNKGIFEEEDLESILSDFNEQYEFSEKLSGQDISIGGSMGLDTINTYSDSISLRGLQHFDLAYNGLTVEIDVFGNLKALIPISFNNHLGKSLANEYSEIIRGFNNHSFDMIKILDGRQIYGAICALIYKYSLYLQKSKYIGHLEFKFRLKNCWRTSVYFDSKEFLEHVKKLGIPICMKNEQYFMEDPHAMDVRKILEHPISASWTLVTNIIGALGVPKETCLISFIEEASSKSEAT